MATATSSLPPAADRCLHRHTRYLLSSMAPDGVYVYLSGARVLDSADHQQFAWAHDVYEKNHALLTIVAKHGIKGFETFLEALETTRQTEIAQTLHDTLADGNLTPQSSTSTNNADVQSLGNNKKNVNATAVIHHAAGPSPSSSSPSRRASPALNVQMGPLSRPSAAGKSPSFSSSIARRTPLTPPLTERELDDHLNRLKGLLRKITTSHGDTHCRHEAQDLLGELDDAGEAMVVRLQHLSEENAEKERELRRAKFMVRGMETEIQRLKTTTFSSTQNHHNDDDDDDSGDHHHQHNPHRIVNDGDDDDKRVSVSSVRGGSNSQRRSQTLGGAPKTQKTNRSKTCVVL